MFILFYFMVIDHSISNTSEKGWSTFCPPNSLSTFSFNEKRKEKQKAVQIGFFQQEQKGESGITCFDLLF